MPIGADRREWRHLGATDPMRAICSTPDRAHRWSAEQFFQTGETEIAGLLAGLEALDLTPELGRALDFGSGLGRLTRALAVRFSEAVGIDISREMIDEAARLNAGQSGCRFILNERSDVLPVPSDSFDLVLSLITLQHVSDRSAIRSYIQEFVRAAAPGGIIVFQLPERVAWRVTLHPRAVIRRALWRLPELPAAAKRLGGTESLTLTALPKRDVLQILRDSSADVLAAIPDNRVGSSAVPSVCYFARKR